MANTNSAVAVLLRQALTLLEGGPAAAPTQTYLPVYDVQPLGFTRIGAVEAFRDELRAESDTSPKKQFATRFADLLPDFWFVQDAENYVTLTPQQQQLQEFNCGNARFTLAIMGKSADGKHLWRKWWPAVTREWSETAQGFVDTPIVHEGKAVYAVANDSRNPAGRVLTLNPRVSDMGKVVRAAYDYFYETNKDAKVPVSALGGVFSGDV